MRSLVTVMVALLLSTALFMLLLPQAAWAREKEIAVKPGKLISLEWMWTKDGKVMSGDVAFDKETYRWTVPTWANDMRLWIQISDPAESQQAEYALNAELQYMESFDELFDELGIATGGQGSVDLYIPHLFADFDENGIPDDNTTLYTAVDIRTYYLSNPEFATTSHLGEELTFTDGILVPGYYVSTIPIEFTPGTGFEWTGPPGNRHASAYCQETFTVPEPSTLVLLGFGALTLLAYAWRRRTNGGPPMIT